jgi:hypothetical protein
MMTTVNRVTAFPQGTIGGALLGLEAVVLIEGAAGLHNPWIMLGTGIAGGIGGGIGGYFLDSALDGDPTMPATIPPQGMTMISSGFLIVGLGLVIPTAIVFTGATMYRPPETSTTETDDSAGNSTALEESGGPANAAGATAPAGGAGTASPPASTGSGGAGGAGGAGGTTGTGASGGTSSLQHGRSTAHSRVAHRMTLPTIPHFGIGQFAVGRTGVSLGIPTVGSYSSVSLEERRQYNVAPQSEWRINVLNGTF